MTVSIIQADCLDWMRQQPAGIVDLVLGSPPYEDARLYLPIQFKLCGQQWVDWMIPRIVEMCRVSSGLVFVVAAGKRKDWKYSPVVEWLVADLTRSHGIVCGPAPYVFHRIGIPGSGSGKYHRRDWEPVYAFARPENVPPQWTDNTAMGHPPRWAPGGAMSHRLSDGTCRNQWGGGEKSTGGERQPDGSIQQAKPHPSHKIFKNGKRPHTKSRADGSDEVQFYSPPDLADPGNVIQQLYAADEVAAKLAEAGDVTHHLVGGGLMGSNIAHENEAPFPESLAEFFIRSFCPPKGKILDPFSGSGTTAAVAKRFGRNAIAVDIRESQCDLARRRLATVQPELFA